MNPPPTLVIAAPASGSGKTVLTLALLRCLHNRGVAVASFKVGPDYIDPAFHSAASGRACINFDSWAMRPETLAALAAELGGTADLIIGEGVMGLFDGAASGDGSTADLAAAMGWPVILVVDVRGQAASAAALVSGFAGFRANIQIAGVIFNRTGSAHHERLLRDAMAPLAIPVLGCVPRRAELTLPDRHLGLVQAGEHGDLESFLEAAARIVGDYVDIHALASLARSGRFDSASGPAQPLPPLGQRIAVARDAAFAFSYPSVLEGWQRQGSEILPFSPLAGEAPDGSADAIYMPGGYPELHAGRLAAATGFLDGLRAAAEGGASVYGECGGYMVLGEVLVDGDGVGHAMAGLLALETSFAEPRLHLGYRQVRLTAGCALGARDSAFRGHEFHYATILSENGAAPLFACRNAQNTDLGSVGSRSGTVMGSFVHLIDRA